jgi:two-component system LytT family response regulator/two-component system response regulator LytT
MVLRALIVDDEKLARRELRRLLEAVSEVEVVGEAKNGLEALERIEALKPDLVFLDVEMPGLDGIGVAERLVEEDRRPHVVFVTAYDHYAVKAFEVNAVDYLLKPVDPERLQEAVERAGRAREEGGGGEALEKLLAQWRGGSEASDDPPVRRLTLRVEGTLRVVDPPEVLYASVEDGVVVAATPSFKGAMGCESLEEALRLLGPRFRRVHRKFVVNLEAVDEVIPWFSGTYRVRLHTGKEIPVSRGHAKELRKVLRF